MYNTFISFQKISDKNRSCPFLFFTGQSSQVSRLILVMKIFISECNNIGNNNNNSGNIQKNNAQNLSSYHHKAGKFYVLIL